MPIPANALQQNDSTPYQIPLNQIVLVNKIMIAHPPAPVLGGTRLPILNLKDILLFVEQSSTYAEATTHRQKAAVEATRDHAFQQRPRRTGTAVVNVVQQLISKGCTRTVFVATTKDATNVLARLFIYENVLNVPTLSAGFHTSFAQDPFFGEGFRIRR
ncbi:MAG: hypothetical protein LQ351_002174 [Letrouitia transgressa]|nr:MAG: hypothetical protein LQ351_002174 [Letrouitia transgressa]